MTVFSGGSIRDSLQGRDGCRSDEPLLAGMIGHVGGVVDEICAFAWMEAGTAWKNIRLAVGPRVGDEGCSSVDGRRCFVLSMHVNADSVLVSMAATLLLLLAMQRVSTSESYQTCSLKSAMMASMEPRRTNSFLRFGFQLGLRFDDECACPLRLRSPRCLVRILGNAMVLGDSGGEGGHVESVFSSSSRMTSLWYIKPSALPSLVLRRLMGVVKWLPSPRSAIAPLRAKDLGLVQVSKISSALNAEPCSYVLQNGWKAWFRDGDASMPCWPIVLICPQKA